MGRGRYVWSLLDGLRARTFVRSGRETTFGAARPAVGGWWTLGGPCREALTEAVGFAAELEQMAAMGETVEQRRDQASVVVEDAGPVRELEVGSDRECAPGVAMGEQDEEQLGLVSVQLDKAQFVQDEKVEAVELLLEA